MRIIGFPRNAFFFLFWAAGRVRKEGVKEQEQTRAGRLFFCSLFREAARESTNTQAQKGGWKEEVDWY